MVIAARTTVEKALACNSITTINCMRCMSMSHQECLLCHNSPSPFIFHMSRHNFSSPTLLQLKQVMVITHRLREMASKAKVAVERKCNLELAIESPCSPIIGCPCIPPRVNFRDSNWVAVAPHQPLSQQGPSRIRIHSLPSHGGLLTASHMQCMYEWVREKPFIEGIHIRYG